MIRKSWIFFALAVAIVTVYTLKYYFGFGGGGVFTTTGPPMARLIARKSHTDGGGPIRFSPLTKPKPSVVPSLPQKENSGLREKPADSGPLNVRSIFGGFRRHRDSQKPANITSKPTTVPVTTLPKRVRPSTHIPRQPTVIRTTLAPSTARPAAPADPYGRTRSQFARFQGTTIPHIIHQTWDSYRLPGTFKSWVRTWLEQNPGWEYWLWTPRDIEALLRKFYPQYLSLYRQYPSMLKRSDVMRYFVMHKFGGVYADMDMYDIKPLARWADHHACILSEETLEHPLVLYERARVNVMTTILLCRPNHPFYKHTQQRLAASAHIQEVLDSTGPFFLDRSYLAYTEKLKRRTDTVPDADKITVVDPKYFLPTFDPMQIGTFNQKCASPGRFSGRAAQLCRDYMQGGRRDNRVGPEAYTDHKWVHVSMKPQSWKYRDMFDILSVVPRCKNVSAIIASL